MHVPLVSRYTHWLHTRWPAGLTEKLPVVNDDGSTNVTGLWVVGDLSGVPLLKFSADTGAKVVRKIAEGTGRARGLPVGDDGGPLDLVIVGAGVSGVSAALEAKKLGLRFALIEAAERFSTIVNFPKAKPIYTYPAGMTPAGDLHFRDEIHPREMLLDDLKQQAAGIEPRQERVTHVTRGGGGLRVHVDGGETIAARDVVIAIGRSGNYRMLNVPGEGLDKVSNRLHDPKEYAGKNVLVVGGGDSALETAIAVAESGGHVTMSYRKPEFARPKAGNVEKLEMLRADPHACVQIEGPASGNRTSAAMTEALRENGSSAQQHRRANASRPAAGSIELLLPSTVKRIEADRVVLDVGGAERAIDNDYVFTMIGREPPLEFFRRSGVKIHGERTATWWATLVLSLLIFTFVYHWKKGGVHILPFPPFSWIEGLGNFWSARGWFPYNVPEWWAGLGAAFANPANLLGTLKTSLGEPGFFYSAAYCAAIFFFGLQRIRRRKTAYVKAQTYSLMAFQFVPLFLLPYIVLPWMGHNGLFDGGALKWVADQLFPVVTYGHGREYWRAFGLILAWPLFIWNVFTESPMWLWLGISVVQTFVIIPAIIYFWGKGAYCGWVCSCGALAETMGDAHRSKMPHGPFWNRFNMVGQVFLAFAMLLLALRVVGWIFPGSVFGRAFAYLLKDAPLINYVWFVDLLWAGILGVALYWHFSGRVWCRFACPLAALMHIYARFSRFAIVRRRRSASAATSARASATKAST
jgi:thioredoxin reductase